MTKITLFSLSPSLPPPNFPSANTRLLYSFVPEPFSNGMATYLDQPSMEWEGCGIGQEWEGRKGADEESSKLMCILGTKPNGQCLGLTLLHVRVRLIFPLGCNLYFLSIYLYFTLSSPHVKKKKKDWLDFLWSDFQA